MLGSGGRGSKSSPGLMTSLIHSISALSILFNSSPDHLPVWWGPRGLVAVLQEPEAPHRRQAGEEVTARPWAEGPSLANNYSRHKKAMAGFTMEKRLS